MATSAPACASTVAMPRPMPVLDPVTMARWFVRSILYIVGLLRLTHALARLCGRERPRNDRRPLAAASDYAAAAHGHCKWVARTDSADGTHSRVVDAARSVLLQRAVVAIRDPSAAAAGPLRAALGYRDAWGPRR